MPLFVARLPPLVIPNGQQASNSLASNVAFEDAEFVLIFGNNVNDPPITFVIQVTDNITALAPIWYNLQTSPPNPVDAAPPLQGKAFPMSRAAAAIMGTDGFRIFASAPVTAARTWTLTKQFRTETH